MSSFGGSGRWGRRLLGCVLACGLGGSALAQMAPRLTGAAVIAQLDAAQRDLAARGQMLAEPQLVSASAQLGQMSAALRQALGNDSAKPVEIIDETVKASAWRAAAAAQRTQAYLKVADGCLGADATAMTAALVDSIQRLAAAPASSAKAQPVINAVETADQRPLFVLRPGSDKPLLVALTGANLVDPQCVDPQITVTDEHGTLLDPQPTVGGISPARIELKVAAGTALKPGGYVVHVVPKRKAFLVGCTVQPEAVAVLQVAAPLKFSVDYTVTASCRVPGATGAAGQDVAPVTGTMPDITAYGATVQQQVDTSACADPLSYAVSAKVRFGDGHTASTGPIVQSADASITAGLPGGLSLNWNPTVHTVFVRSGANACKGVY